MSPELVAPMVAFLAHEDCPVSGEIYTAGAGRFARLFIASTEGYVRRGGRRRSRTSPRTGTPINDETGYYVPADLMDWSTHFMKHLERRLWPLNRFCVGSGRPAADFYAETGE